MRPRGYGYQEKPTFLFREDARAHAVRPRSEVIDRERTVGVFQVGSTDMLDSRVVWCRGELDISSEAQVVAELAKAFGRPIDTVVLDLQGLTFSDCTAIRCIEYAVAGCKQCGVTLYVDTGEVVDKLVETLGSEVPANVRSYLQHHGGSQPVP